MMQRVRIGLTLRRQAWGKERTLYIAGTKGGCLGKEWLENYVTMGFPLLINFLAYPMEYPIEFNKRYDQFGKFMMDHPGGVENMVTHSKASAVVEVWMKRHPEFKGKHKAHAQGSVG